jgi:hypothetical protein
MDLEAKGKDKKAERASRKILTLFFVVILMILVILFLCNSVILKVSTSETEEFVLFFWTSVQFSCDLRIRMRSATIKPRVLFIQHGCKAK